MIEFIAKDYWMVNIKFMQDILRRNVIGNGNLVVCLNLNAFFFNYYIKFCYLRFLLIVVRIVRPFSETSA